MSNFRDQIVGWNQRAHGHTLIYFDHAATTHMPQVVVRSIMDAMTIHHGTPHRSTHLHATKATDAYERARNRVAQFIQGKSHEVVCTSGTTQGLNMVAHCAGNLLARGDTVLLSVLAHHAHLLPWQKVASEKGLQLKCIPITASGFISLIDLEDALRNGGVNVIGVPWISNVLAVEQPIKEIVHLAKKYNARVVVDAAQAVPHRSINVEALGIDALVFGAHKMFGPTGAGALWVREDWLKDWAPFVVGGGSIMDVSFEESTFLPPPHRFEAGTPNVAGVVGMAAAIDWLESVGWTYIHEQEKKLCAYLRHRFEQRSAVRLVHKHPSIPLFSFVVEGVHAHDIGTMLDFHGIAVRTGHHCTAPLHEFLGMMATTRISLSFLNTISECDAFFDALDSIMEQFGVR